MGNRNSRLSRHNEYHVQQIRDNSFYNSESDINKVDKELSNNRIRRRNKNNDFLKKSNFIDKPKITKLYSKTNKEMQVNKYKIETNAIIHYTKGEYITLIKFPINSNKFYVRCYLEANFIKHNKDGSYGSTNLGYIEHTFISSDYETKQVDSCGVLRNCDDFHVRRVGSYIYYAFNSYQNMAYSKLSCLLTLHLNCINDQKFIMDYIRILHHHFSRKFSKLYDTNLTKEIIKYLIPNIT